MVGEKTLTAVLLSLALCAVVAALSPLLLRPLLHRTGVLDVPNSRSSHATTIVRGGGLASLLAIGLAGVVAPQSFELWWVLVLSVLAGVLGFIDDVRSLSAGVRFGAQLGLGALLGVVMVAGLGSPWWSIPVAVLFFAASVNMANFMDGINAISSLHGFVAGAAFVFIGVVQDREWMVIAGSLIGIAFLLFLPWNLLGRRMFLGDCGSYLLGASTVTVALLAIAGGAPWPAALAPLAVYAADTSQAIIIRAVGREKIWEAHRRHHYQQLVDAGLSHVRAAGFVSGFTVLAAAAGSISLLGGPMAMGVSVVLVVSVALLYLAVSRGVVRFLGRTR